MVRFYELISQKLQYLKSFPLSCRCFYCIRVSIHNKESIRKQVNQNYPHNVLCITYCRIQLNVGELISRSTSCKHSEAALHWCPSKKVLKICRKFTGENSCQSVTSVKLLSNFIEIALRYRFSPVNLLLISRTPFLKEHFWRAASETLQKQYLTSILYLYNIYRMISSLLVALLQKV